MKSGIKLKSLGQSYNLILSTVGKDWKVLASLAGMHLNFRIPVPPALEAFEVEAQVNALRPDSLPGRKTMEKITDISMSFCIGCVEN
jgi:hypothetical protein